jgi:hypothetical protein
MLKKLEVDALKADLAAVNALLTARTEDDDPVGWLQLSSRKADIENELTQLEAAPETRAAVALFFGGRPVLGSKGIAANFAGKAIDRYQDLLAKRYAALESRPLGDRGPVPQHANAQMLITEVARGSFGFVLEEASETTSLVDTPLKQVVDEISDLIYRLSAMDETGFETVAETLDDRLLASLKEFFKLLDDGGATLKLVEGQKEYVLQREDVERARTRADSMEIGEREQEETGVVYLLPDSRRFELHPTDSGLVRRGTVTADCLKELRGEAAVIPAEAIGRPWRVRLKVREVRQRSGAAKVSHTLTQLIERA